MESFICFSLLMSCRKPFHEKIFSKLSTVLCDMKFKVRREVAVVHI
jgi:hypothetical protein